MSGKKGELTQTEREEQRQRKLNRLNALGMSPASSIPLTCLMLWLCGNDIGIFSIMMTGNAISSPIMQLIGANQQFAVFQKDEEVKEDVLKSKLMYMGLCFVALLIGLAKLHFMGLLPTSAADWLDHTPPQYTIIAQPGILS